MSPRCAASNFWRTLIIRGRATSSPPAMFTSILSSITFLSSGGLIVGHDIRSLGNHRQRMIPAAFDAALQRFLPRMDHVDPREHALARWQAAAVQMHRAVLHGLQLHLGLPFIDIGKLL